MYRVISRSVHPLNQQWLGLLQLMLLVNYRFRCKRSQQNYLMKRDMNTMKTDSLKKRLDRNRPMKTIIIRMPEDVIEDWKKIAPLLGFSGYQPLARAYIGQGLRADVERLEGDTVSA